MKQDRSIHSANVHPIVRRLTEIRLGWGLTTFYVADKIGCSAMTLNHMESGYRNPGFKVLVSWARALGYDVALKPRSR